MSSAVTVAWITLTLLGQWSLLFLLSTFLFADSLPQGNNPFLFNFLFTTFLATLPPTLLFFSGYQDDVPPHWLCVMQSVLMDSIAPMFGIALLILVFHTWAEVIALVRDVTNVSKIMKAKIMKWLLLLTPYMVLASWCAASLVAVFQPTAHVDRNFFVFCANQPSIGVVAVRKKVGPFMIACGFLELFLQGHTAYLLFTGGSASAKFVESYRANVHMSVRMFTYICLQFAPIIIVMINHIGEVSQDVGEALESTDALVTFLIFGTQKSVIQTWKSWIWRAEKKEIEEQGHDMNSVDSVV